MILDKKVRVISSCYVDGLGLLVELQHNENGLSSGLILKKLDTNEFWTVQKRVFDGELMINEKEIYFDCEKETTHLSNHLNQEKKEEHIRREVDKRKSKIYKYLIIPCKKGIMLDNGSELEILEQSIC